MSEERLNSNFNINVKYETMLEEAKSIVDGYLSHAGRTCEPPTYISLAYDVKNYLPKLQQENQQLKDENDKIKRAIIENCDLRLEVLKYKEVIEEVKKWLKYKAETLDKFDIPKRKETGAFWFTTRGEIDNLLQILDKGESKR